MNSEVNHNSSSYQSTSYLINHPRDLGDKLEHTLAIHTELVDALKQHGCSNCIALLRDIVRKHSGNCNRPLDSKWKNKCRHDEARRKDRHRVSIVDRDCEHRITCKQINNCSCTTWDQCVEVGAKQEKSKVISEDREDDFGPIGGP